MYRLCRPLDIGRIAEVPQSLGECRDIFGPVDDYAVAIVDEKIGRPVEARGYHRPAARQSFQRKSARWVVESGQDRHIHY